MKQELQIDRPVEILTFEHLAKGLKKRHQAGNRYEAQKVFCVTCISFVILLFFSIVDFAIAL